MPLTAECAIRMLRTEFAGTSGTTAESRLGLVTDTNGTQAPTATAPGNAINGDPRVPVPAWDNGATAAGISAIKNVGAFSFTNMQNVPTPGVTHFNVYDAGATPKRRAYGQLGAARVTVSGDTLTFADGSLSVGLVTSPGSTASV